MRPSCENGWTGGQYSAFRFVLGAYLIVQLSSLIWRDPDALVTLPLVAGIGASLLFALGVRDRIAACALLGLEIGLSAVHAGFSNGSALFVGCILFAHLFVPPAPYGSWDARGRTDPSADWQMPTSVQCGLWSALAVGYVLCGATQLGEADFTSDAGFATGVIIALELAFAPLAFSRRLRPWLWLTLLCMLIGRMLFGALSDFESGIAILHVFAFDPAWIARKADDGRAIIFYDGGCGLCHRFVRFTLAEDARGEWFRYAPLGGEAFGELCDSTSPDQSLDEIDSIVLRLPDGRSLVRSAAVLEIGRRLGGIWRIEAFVGGLLPRSVLDFGYDRIARMRHQIFSKPDAVCPILPAHLRERFDLS
jgi:predicted DCC family thiol-disulfide oxidoreductase YuxK